MTRIQEGLMRTRLAAPLMAAAILISGSAQAAEEPFFAGKTIRILVGYPPGSSRD